MRHALRNEFVIRATGEVVARAPDAVNPNLPTGEVELQVERLEILSRSTPLPFQLDEENVDETIRLRYRWLDMRREQMQRNLRLSHTIVQSIRRTMDGRDFIDVWTPGMTRGTPEGARDFLVPVRLQPGKFFAIAQSPQLFKQLCVIGGLDRYYQIATCWRDEDLRADRQFEFRQLDLEMAFVERRGRARRARAGRGASAFEAVGREPPARPFPRMGYDEAIAKYGTDKPDLRFGLEIEDATEVTRGSEFGVFAERGDGAVHRRPERVLARGARPPRRRSRRSGGRRGSPTSSTAPTARRGRRSRSSSPSRGAGRVRGGARLDRPLRRRRPGDGRARPRRDAAARRTGARSRLGR